jgi:hypothetical protein
MATPNTRLFCFQRVQLPVLLLGGTGFLSRKAENPASKKMATTSRGGGQLLKAEL